MTALELDDIVILNIIDRRTNAYRWKLIDAIIESAWHDNACHDVDHQLAPDYREPNYAARKGIPLAKAVRWASSLGVALIFYLYDAGSDAVTEG